VPSQDRSAISSPGVRTVAVRPVGVSRPRAVGDIPIAEAAGDHRLQGLQSDCYPSFERSGRFVLLRPQFREADRQDGV